MRQGLSRVFLGLVLVLFCVPLFVGLGRSDLVGDEAIYSFAVDRILETGDWLTPRSSPYDDAAFLEKPPLKIWLVAAPIRAGWLPHTEFGLRFWDALLGGLAFVYTFLIAARLSNGLGGAVAVLLLFVHQPLLFDHGLRSNNMEAALTLSYCGGVYHFLGWCGSRYPRRRALHLAGTVAYFVLGFMTKFVAVLFLPLVLGAAVLLSGRHRAMLARDWRGWAAGAALATLCIAPWFVYESVTHGSSFWNTIFVAHVLLRFTGSEYPGHLHAWSFYFTEVYRRLAESGASLLVFAGCALLAVEAVRRRWFEGTVIVLWFGLPLLLMSAGTSKQYHYTYPFLPPMAIGGGYLVGIAAMLAPIPVARWLEAVHAAATARVPSIATIGRDPRVRAAMFLLVGMAVALAAINLVNGPTRIAVGRSVLFRSSGILRPLLVVALVGALGGASGQASRILVALVLAAALPLQAYRDTLPRLSIDQRPMRTASDCLVRLAAQAAGPSPGLYVDVPPDSFTHPLNYYFRRVRPVTRAPASDAAILDRYLHDPAALRPMLLWDSTYQAFMAARASLGSRPPSPPMVVLSDVVLLLPGPYAACSAAPATLAQTD